MIKFRSGNGQKRKMFNALRVKPYYREYFEFFALKVHLDTPRIPPEDLQTEPPGLHDLTFFEIKQCQEKEDSRVTGQKDVGSCFS